MIEELVKQISLLQRQVDGLIKPEVPLGLSLISELTAVSSSMSFTSIPSGFRHLLIVGRMRVDTSAEGDEVKVQFNGDTGGNYDFQQLYGNSATAAASTIRATTSILALRSEAANSRADVFAAGICLVFGYSISGVEKTTLSINQTFGNLSADADLLVLLRSGLWRNTAIITSIALSPNTGPNFVTGTRFQLYGIM